MKGFIYADQFEKAKKITTNRGKVIVPFVMFETPDSQYSDYSIKEDVPKGEPRQSDFLGNASMVVKREPPAEPEKPAHQFKRDFGV